MNNKIILINNISKIEILNNLGFNSCGVRQMNGEKYHQFVLTKELSEALNDKVKFSKQDYIMDSKLTF